MNEEKLKKIGFKLIGSYVHGDNKEYVTRTFSKKNINLELNFDKITGIYISNDVGIEIDAVENITFSELKYLDNLLNKK